VAASVHALAADEAGAQIKDQAAAAHAQDRLLLLDRTLLLLGVVVLSGGALASLHWLGGLVLHLDVVLCRHLDWI